MTHIEHPCTECERQGIVLLTPNPENEYGEFICIDCEASANEGAYERQCESYHDGGDTSWLALQEQQIAARKLK